MNQAYDLEANVDTIVHLGAGTCSDLTTWQAANPRRIVLVEPNPHHTHHLTAHARGDERIHVLQQAVGDPDASPRLRRFNIPALSSLREPTGLLELFPGLRTEREFDVEVIEPRALIQSLELEPDNRHWLIIDTPGEEAAVVKALHADGQLDHFERIVLHCGTDSLYENNAPAATVLDQLAEAGYDIEQRDDSDPDRPAWTLDRNPLRFENQALHCRVAELEQQAQELTQSRDERAREAEEHRQAHEALQKEKENLEGKVVNLEKQLNEASTREQVLREQVTRAEGQIELVKDLVMDRPAL